MMQQIPWLILWYVFVPLAGVILLIGAWRLRRWLRGPGRDQTSDFDFQLDQLFRLQQTGKISTEEFEQAKASVLSRREAQAAQPGKRGFEVRPRKPMIQSLEDRWAP